MVKKTASKRKKTGTKSHTVKLKKDDYEITITETPKKKTTKKAKTTKVNKKHVRKKPTKVHHSTKEIKVEKVLVENFIGLQKVMVNLSGRFDELSNQISKLLNLFEVSARAMAKKEFAREQDPNIKKVLDRLDNITQQAGLIGRGLALIHEVNEEKHRESAGPKATHFEPQPSPSPIKPPIRTPPAPSGMQPSIMQQSHPTTPPQIKKPLEIPKDSKIMEINEKDV